MAKVLRTLVGNPGSSSALQQGAGSGAIFQRFLTIAAILGSLFGLVACSNEPEPGQVMIVDDWAGIVIADEPNAVLVGEEILAQNGTAADAASAMALTMAVTMPSRVGLAGGGICMAFSRVKDGPNKGDAIVFTPMPGASGVVMPRMARGIAVLHARHGSQLWGDMVQPAETLARFGHQVSRAFASDLRKLEEYEATPELIELFTKPNGDWLDEGDRLVQPGVAATLSGIRLRGGAYMNMGDFARRMVEGAQAAGYPMTPDMLRDAKPELLTPLTVEAGPDKLLLPPAPLASGREAAAAYERLDEQGWADAQVAEREEIAASFPTPLFASFPGSDMAAGLVVGDRFGNSVACSFTLNRLFGSGAVLGETGLLLAAPPTMDPEFLSLTPALFVNFVNGKSRLAVSANGPQSASLAAAALVDAVDARSLRFEERSIFGARIPRKGDDRRLFATGQTDRPRQTLSESDVDPSAVVAGGAEGRASFFFCQEGLRESGPTGDCLALSDPNSYGMAQILRN